MKKQKQVLIVLLGILALALLYAYWTTPRQRRIATPETSPPDRLAATVQPEPREPSGVEEDRLRVRLDLLQREPEEFSGFERDIFHFPPVRRPAPPAAPPVPAPRAADSPPGEERPLPPAELRRELAHFIFLGYLQKGSTKTIFLESGEDIFVVKPGDRFGEEDKFLVSDLTTEALTIRQRGDERPIVVPLVEQAPLIPRRAMTPGMQPDLQPDMRPDIQRDMEPDWELEAEPDVEPDMGPDTEPDMEPDMDPDTMKFGPKSMDG